MTSDKRLSDADLQRFIGLLPDGVDSDVQGHIAALEAELATEKVRAEKAEANVLKHPFYLNVKEQADSLQARAGKLRGALEFYATGWAGGHGERAREALTEDGKGEKEGA